MRVFWAGLLLAAAVGAEDLRSALRSGDPKKIVAAPFPKPVKAREAVALCRMAADLALRIDSPEREKWIAVADRLATFAQEGGGGLYWLWAQTEVDVFRWRLKPTDSLKFLESIRDLSRKFQQTNVAADVHLRAAEIHLETIGFPGANWYGCAGGLVYLHRKMELLKLDPDKIAIVKAGIDWAEAEAFTRGEKQKPDEAKKKIEAGLARLAPLLKRDPHPHAVMRHNDLVFLARARLAMKPDFHLVFVDDAPAGARYGLAPSGTWRRDGDTIRQLAPGGKLLREIRVAKSEGEDPTKLARGLMKDDKKRVKSKRKVSGPKKAPFNEKIKKAVYYEVSGEGAAKRMVRFRCWILGTKKAAFVVRLIEHGIPAANDPGLELFIRYLSIR